MGQPSGAAKRNKRKKDNRMVESQRGALDKFFPTKRSIDVNNNNQRQESDSGQDDENNSNADLEANKKSSENGK